MNPIYDMITIDLIRIVEPDSGTVTALGSLGILFLSLKKFMNLL